MTALVILAFCFVVLVVIYVIETVWPEQPDPDLASPDGWDPEKAAAWDSLWDAGHDR